ncbi:hypothetical protein IWX90DRAFT_124912 [Phyllosticta citrichinensis]|uniref:Ankyrin repeat protein n=1 Tax=Phyllosticta citrichinensis TaxID=1130410 RepID=A0ABR1Y4M3_9PEZI
MLKVFEEQFMRKNETRSVDQCANSNDEKTQADLNRCLARAERDVFIVVDALDQLDKDDQRHFVNGLDALFREHQKSANKCRLAVAISSRESFNYEKLKPHGLKPIRVKHDNNAKDIHLYLEKYLDSDLFQQDRKLKTEVRDALENQADGIFLWAKLQTIRFCNMHYESAVRPALTELTPLKEMDRIYEFYVKDFESPDRDPKERQITTRTMALLAHTTGSMPLKVLLEALALDITTGRPDNTFRNELYKDPTKIIQSCNSLIDINNKLGSVRFCHRSAFDFFTRYKPADTHKLIAELCLAHLCSPDFTVGPCDNAKWYDYSSLEPFLLKHPFLEFASCNWAPSAKKSFDATASGTIKETHAGLLNCFKKLFETSRAKQKRRSKKNQNLQLSFQVYLMTLGKSLPPGIHLEHIISYFSLHEFLDYFVKKRLLDLKKRDDEGSTVFHWAIRNRTGPDEKNSEAAKMVRALLKHLKDPNAQDSEGRTPLHYASHHGRLHLVRLLIQNDADLNRKSNERETALIAACREHHEEVASELLEAGADVEVQSFFGTALQAVSLIGCDRCVKSILTRYKTQTKPIEESKGPFGTSLHAAAFHGHLSVVELLLGEKISEKKKETTKKDRKREAKEEKTRNRLNIHATNETYGSILTAAATGCSVTMDPASFQKIFQTLIDHGVDVNDGTGRYGPALRAAASNGQLPLVELLCQKGALISSAEGPMGIAYQAAEEGGYKDIMKFLQDQDPKAAEYNTVTPLEGKQEFTIITVNRNLFETAVSECNMAVIKRIIRFAEGFFEFWMKSGKTPILEAMTLVCKEIFEFVVILATTENAKAELETVEEEGEEERDAPDEYARDGLSTRGKSQEAFEPLAASEAIPLGPRSEPPSPSQKRQLFVGRGKRCRKMFRRLVHKIRRKDPSGGKEDAPGPSVPQNQNAPEFPVPLSPVSERAEWQDSTDFQSFPEQKKSTLGRGNGPEDNTTGLETVPKPNPSKAAAEQRHLAAPDADTRPRLSISSLATAQRQYRPRPSLASNRGSFVVKITRRSPTAESTPRRSSLGRDDLEGHYREVLNQLTRAAVKILENAIWQHVDSAHANLEHADSNHIRTCDELQVINLLANSWVEALNNFIVMSREEMLQNILIARTEELKGCLVNPKYTQRKRIKKAEGLARVGVELLMTSIRRGAQFKRLSDILAKLWIPAVIAVDDLGKEGEEIVTKFVSMFAEWFSRAAQARDRKNAETYAQGGFQLLREAALSRQKGLMDKLVDEWVRQWKLAIDYKMGDVITDMVQDGLEEYKKCVSEEMHVEALGLAVGGIGLLRAAIKQGIGEVAHSFLPQVVSAFKWTTELPTVHSAPEPAQKMMLETPATEWGDPMEQIATNLTREDVGGEHVEAITEAVIRLIHTAEKHDPDRAATLALVILDWFESIPPENQQELSGLVHQGIQYGRKGAYGQNREVELARIATTIIYLLNKQLCFGKLRPNTLAVLESLAHSMPGITERSGFSRYEEAIAFLRLPNGKDDVAKVRGETMEDQNDNDEGQKQSQKEEHDQEERLKEQQEKKPDGEREDEQNHKQENKEDEKSNHEDQDKQEDEQRPKGIEREGDQKEGKGGENQVDEEEDNSKDKLEDKLDEKQKTLQDGQQQEAWNVGAVCFSVFVNVLYLYQYIY